MQSFSTGDSGVNFEVQVQIFIAMHIVMGDSHCIYLQRQKRYESPEVL